ncbi:MAG: hypothetical protein U9Q16_00525 [Patescibacteria group bacterium]|nr:hypothetical protein [Patescibacteria group bacterium]
MKQILKFKIVIFIAVFLFSAPVAFASEIFLETRNSEIQIGDKFEVGFFLDTEDEDINAIEGKIVFPETLLNIKEIKDGNSIINFWIERPKISDKEILFSGIIPGGYSGKRGLIFSVVFQSTQEGKGLIEIHNIKVLLNDGKGTEAGVTTSNLQFVISKQAPPYQPVIPEKEDVNMPEMFEPIVTSDPTVFDGKYFLVFATQDKGSGIDYYEVCEGKRKCVIVESPYLLQNQNLDEEIIIKAVDKNNNQRVVVLPSQKIKPLYKNYVILAMLIIGMLIITYIIWRFLWKKRRKYNF